MKINKKLVKKIIQLPKDIPQNLMQKHLEEVFNKSNMETVLEGLFQWELKTGYLTKEKLTENIKIPYYDKNLKITFTLQINITRSKYSPKPLPPDKKIPKLHCPICIENIGIPGKEYLRVFIFPIDGKDRTFFIQATPFPFFNKHFVLINMEKIPQKIDKTTLYDLFNFTDLAPHYVSCSNSDLKWTGASILNHMHYQVFGNLHLPVFESIQHYPAIVIKLKGKNRESIITIMNKIIYNWKNENKKKQTVNLIVRKIKKNYEGYIFLRHTNFRTTPEFQKFKSEGVGILEMSGEIIVPVPNADDPEKEYKWNIYKNNGLYIIHGILKTNTPSVSLEKIEYLISQSLKEI